MEETYIHTPTNNSKLAWILEKEILYQTALNCHSFCRFQVSLFCLELVNTSLVFGLTHGGRIFKTFSASCNFLFQFIFCFLDKEQPRIAATSSYYHSYSFKGKCQNA